MNNSEIDLLIYEGNQMLQRALEEVNRPAEDVACLAVCKGTKLSMDNFLKAFLLKNNIDPESLKTIRDRYEKCLIIDPSFKAIDIYLLECIDEEKCSMNEYCLSVEKVNECIVIAENLRNKIVMS